MSKLQRILGAYIGVGLAYLGVSSHMAKALPRGHSHSSQRWHNDLGDDQYSRGYVSAQDGLFSAKVHATAGHAALVDGDKIVMGEWGTGQRLRNIIWHRTVAWASPAEQTDAQYFANGDTALFSEGAVAAFPAFTLWAEDPDDTNFTPILLASEADTTGAANAEGSKRPLSAMMFGANRRKRSLLIVARVEGAVPNESGLFLHIDMTEQHK